MKELPGVLKRAGCKEGEYYHDDLSLHKIAESAFNEVFEPREGLTLELVRYTLDHFKTVGHYANRHKGQYGGPSLLDALSRCFRIKGDAPEDAIMLMVLSIPTDAFQRELVYLWHDLHPEPPLGWCIFCRHAFDDEGRRLDRNDYPYWGAGRKAIKAMCHSCYDQHSEDKSCYVCIHSEKNCDTGDDDDFRSHYHTCDECKVCKEGFDPLVDPKADTSRNKPSRAQWKLRDFEDYWDNSNMCYDSYNGSRD
jgi:hypothetical protein